VFQNQFYKHHHIAELFYPQHWEYNVLHNDSGNSLLEKQDLQQKKD
jgi:hypothetical protein